MKLAAAWLVERAGFARGQEDGAAGISTRHTLAIVARDGARAADVVRVARRVRDGVLDRFGVRLHPEPVVLGLPATGARPARGVSRRPAVCGPPGGPVSYPTVTAAPDRPRVRSLRQLSACVRATLQTPKWSTSRRRPSSSLEAALPPLGTRARAARQPTRGARAPPGRGARPPRRGPHASPRATAHGIARRGSRCSARWPPFPALGSDALTLSTTLDKLWAHRVVAAAGVPVPAHASLASPDAAAPDPCRRRSRSSSSRAGKAPPRASARARGSRAARPSCARSPASSRRTRSRPSSRRSSRGPSTRSRWWATTAPGLAHAPAGARGLDRHRSPRARAPSAAARRLAPRHAGRARPCARGRAGHARRCARSRRSSAAISPAPTSAWTAPAGRTSSRSTRSRPSRPTAPSASSRRSSGAPLDDLLAEILGEALARLGLAPPV